MPEPTPPRTCTRCGEQGLTMYCPVCTSVWEKRPDVATMTPQERVDEMRSWRILEIEFDKIHQRIEELVGRPVWTHEMADVALLEHEILTGHVPTIEGVLAKFPADKPVLIVDTTGTDDA